MSIAEIATFIGEVGVLAGVIVPMIVKVGRIADGQKCTLRSDMLRIYYHNKEAERVRQYEYENFVLLYNAYKALGGNSFIDKIYDEVRTWEIIT